MRALGFMLQPNLRSREDELSYEDIQEAGEDFSEQLSRVLEAKIVVNGIKIRLEN